MHKLLTGAIIVAGLAGATIAVPSTASAAGVGISFNLGNVAFGYQDGYWDRSHHWHKWRNRNEARNYRAAPSNQYHDWKHDRNSDRGWHQ